MATRLEQLEKKKAQLEAQIQQAQAREKQKRRKEDTRRKILIGAIAKDNMDMHPDSPFAQELAALLDQHITRPKDRELLNLKPLPAPEQDKPAESMRPNFTMAGG